jgi:large subunit ribosomal protein L4
MQVQLKGLTASGDKAFDLNDSVFAVDFNQGLVHQVVESYRAKQRAGTKANKNRSAVSGGGRKPWRQKGTGNARAGTTRGPLWRSGGVTFAANQRDYTQKVNRKAHKAAMRSILSQLQREERLIFVDDLQVKEAKTSAAVTLLKDYLPNSVYMIVDEINPDLLLATRNLPRVILTTTKDINILSLVHSNHVLITAAAHKELEEKLV